MKTLAKKRNCGMVGKRVSRNAVEIWPINAWTMGRKRIAVNSTCHRNSGELCSEEGRCLSPVDVMIPVKDCSPVFVKKEHLTSESDIELLPLDILVRIICNFHHDEIKPLTHVSSKFREAVEIARQMHFDYSTPVRVRAPKPGANSLMPNESCENYASTYEGLEYLYSFSSKMPATPYAPKQVDKIQKHRIFDEDMKEISTLLPPPGTAAENGDATPPNQNPFFRSGGGIANRVLFVEDELCEAVARNRL